MKIVKLISLLMLLASVSAAQNYSIDWYVIASGGGEASSANYSVNGTIGQPIVGQSSSENYTVAGGYWVGPGGPGSGCDYVVGDVNNSGSMSGSDVGFIVDYLKYHIDEPMCEPCDLGRCADFFYCGDVNNSCTMSGSDVGFIVDWLKYHETPVMPCEDCPPASVLVASVPGQDGRPLVVPKVKSVLKKRSDR